MFNMLKELESLHQSKLYSSVLKVCNLVLTLSEQRPDSLSLQNKLQVTLYYADALYHTEQFLQAENLYRQALQMRKNLIKNRTNNQTDLPSDVDIRYSVYECCMALKHRMAAFEVLQMISVRLRTPKINMALGDLFRYYGKERSAINCYKEVLRERPLALDAVENLLKLGVKGVEVNSLMVDVTLENNWLNQWLKAQAQLHSREFSTAIQTYKAMDGHGLLKDNIYLLVNLGYCHHCLCEDDKAILVLQRAMRLEPDLSFGRDLLSSILATSTDPNHVTYLETLANFGNNVDMSIWPAEMWVVLGNLNFATKKYEKSVYFGHQALLLNQENVEALLLKARSLIEVNKYQDAAAHCVEALRICSYRFDFHECLVDAYVKMNRLREAESMAISACKQLNYSTHSLTLHASVLLKDPMASSKTVKKILEKAVAQDKTVSTNAVFMLVELLQNEQQFEQAVELLSKYSDEFPSSRLHQLLGDCYMNLQKDEEAFDHYNISLRLDPGNQRATEGLNNIGRNVPTKRDNYHKVCLEVMNCSFTSQSTNTLDPESGPESDTDAWPASSSFE